MYSEFQFVLVFGFPCKLENQKTRISDIIPMGKQNEQNSQIFVVNHSVGSLGSQNCSIFFYSIFIFFLTDRKPLLGPLGQGDKVRGFQRPSMVFKANKARARTRLFVFVVKICVKPQRSNCETGRNIMGLSIYLFNKRFIQIYFMRAN